MYSVAAGFLLVVWSLAGWGATAVRTAPLQDLLIRVADSAPAQAVSYEDSTLSAQINGQLLEVPVKVGQSVAQGALLARIDCRDYQLTERGAQASVHSLTAQLELASAQLSRVRQLQDRGNVSRELRDRRQAELDSLRGQLQAAEVTLLQAQLAVSRCDIRAPFAALVTARQAPIGALLAPGSPVLSIISNSPPELSAQLSPAQVAGLQTGEHAVFEAYGERFPLQLRVVVGKLHPTMRTQDVRLEFSDSSPLAGATGRLRWYSREPHLPARYVVRRHAQLGVMLYQQGTSVFHHLPAAIEGQSVAFELPRNTLLITDGRHAVNHGDAVTLIEPPAGSYAATSAE